MLCIACMICLCSWCVLVCLEFVFAGCWVCILEVGLWVRVGFGVGYFALCGCWRVGGCLGVLDDGFSCVFGLCDVGYVA